MSKFKLTIDTDTINMENEIHINNFSQKIKNLAQHCVNYIHGIEDKQDCLDNRFIREFHDDDSDSTIESFTIPSFFKNNINSNCNLYNKGFSPFLKS